MSAAVTDEGQVTIPQEIRDLLGIVPGSKVDFRSNAAGEIVMARADEPSRFAKLRGDAGPGLTTDEVMAMTRGED